MKRVILLLACLGPLFGGCATAKFGKKFTSQDVARIQLCRSTRAQMMATFGEASKEGTQDGYAFTVWQWADMELGAFDSTQDSIRKQQQGQGSLIAFFASNGVVIDYAHNPVAFPRPNNRCQRR